MLKTPRQWTQGHERVNVALIGCGGTGSVLAEHLARLSQTMAMLNHKGLRVVIADDDQVETHNLGRQRFSWKDIGRNKAVTLADRLNRTYNTDFAAYPNRIDLPEGQIASAQIIVTAVDNVSTRQDIHQYVRTHDHPIWWLDTGNGPDYGQVVLGSRETKTIVELHTLKETTESISCSAEESLQRQELFINTHIAGLAIEMLWRAFRHGYLEHSAIYFNSKKMETSTGFYAR